LSPALPIGIWIPNTKEGSQPTIQDPYYKTTWAKLLPAGIKGDDRKRMIFMLAATWPDEIKGETNITTTEVRRNLPTGPEANGIQDTMTSIATNTGTSSMTH